MTDYDDVPTYDLREEDREWVAALEPTPTAFEAFARPAEVPIDWHKTEDQLRLGSCQGNSITSAAEGVHNVETGGIVQLSRICAYLWSQKIDGLLGRDVGSTITSGAKVGASHGFPPESLTGYPSSYPRDTSPYFAAALFEAAKKHMFKNWKRVGSDPEEALALIGGGARISFGIPWYSGLIPRDRIVKSFSVGSGSYGGHAMAALGYTAGGNVLCANSHGDGPYQVTPSAWRQMMSHRYSVLVALVPSGNRPIDWLNNSPERLGR